jgi:NAD(P)-dependent dehydrogenase (short-subunit alcohol dehydrogenase family)
MGYNPFTLSGKTVFITGASSGIGRATAIECTRMGATVIITGRNKERLNESYCKLEGKGHQQFIADLSHPEKIEELITVLPDVHGVVHCAGIANPLLFQFLNEERLKHVFDINFMAPTILTQRLLKMNKVNKNASIVFISSISGVYCSSIGGSIYSASKGAINGLVKGMALDLAPKSIRVNCVNPGMIQTNIFDSGTITKEQLEEDVKKYPLRRYGQPEEVAYAVIYLLSDASKWVTGSNLLIDGGYTLL